MNCINLVAIQLLHDVLLVGATFRPHLRNLCLLPEEVLWLLHEYLPTMENHQHTQKITRAWSICCKQNQLSDVAIVYTGDSRTIKPNARDISSTCIHRRKLPEHDRYVANKINCLMCCLHWGQQDQNILYKVQDNFSTVFPKEVKFCVPKAALQVNHGQHQLGQSIILSTEPQVSFAPHVYINGMHLLFLFPISW